MDMEMEEIERPEETSFVEDTVDDLDERFQNLIHGDSYDKVIGLLSRDLSQKTVDDLKNQYKYAKNQIEDTLPGISLKTIHDFIHHYSLNYSKEQIKENPYTFFIKTFGKI